MQLYASAAFAFTAAVAIGDYQMKWWKISPLTPHGILPGFVYTAYQASDPSKKSIPAFFFLPRWKPWKPSWLDPDMDKE